MHTQSHRSLHALRLRTYNHFERKHLFVCHIATSWLSTSAALVSSMFYPCSTSNRPRSRGDSGLRVRACASVQTIKLSRSFRAPTSHAAYTWKWNYICDMASCRWTAARAGFDDVPARVLEVCINFFGVLVVGTLHTLLCDSAAMTAASSRIICIL